MISVTCSCGRKFKAEEHHAGKRTRCPVCGQLLVIGSTSSVATPPVMDDNEVPSWWFPNSAPLPPSGSGSDPDEVQTAVIRKSKEGVKGPRTTFGVSAGEGGNATVPNAGPLTVLLAVSLGLVGLLGVGALVWLLPGADRAHPAGGNSIPVAEKPRQESPPQDPRPASPPGPLAAQLVQPAQPVQPALVGVVPNPAPPAPLKNPELQVLVPAYFYPAGSGLKEWQRLTDAAKHVRIVAIANPASGPGDQPVLDYSRIIESASAKGVRVIGYVTTEYGKRPLADVTRDIDRWVQFYPQICGIFLDQQSANSRDLPTYARIRDHVQKQLKHPLLVNNPGAFCDEEYFVRDVADVECVFGGFGSFNEFAVPESVRSHMPPQLAAFVCEIRNAAQMRQVLAESVKLKIDYLYISDASRGGNPWERLPSYWEQEVEAIGQVDD